MPKLSANGIRLEYAEFGKKSDPVILLICGWSVQLTFWPDEFIQQLVEGGYRVIAFDNRDAGLSDKMGRSLPTSPFAPHVLASRLMKRKVIVAYTLEDMAADAIGVLDALGIARAHIVGLSMGGMITQIVAADYSDRVETATILMSTTNRFGLPMPSLPLSFKVFFSPQPRRREDQVLRSQRLWEIIRTADGGYSEADFRSGIRSTIDRSFQPAGRRRQMEAIVATGDLRRWTRRISAPSLVIHGSADLLARPHGGIDVAENIPNAEFELIQGMGHDLPPNRISGITKRMLDHFSRHSKTAKKHKLTIVR